MKKRILSLALALGLCLSLMPAASAAETLSEMPDVFQGDGVYVTARELPIPEGWTVHDGVAQGLHEGFVAVTRTENVQDTDGFFTGTRTVMNWVDLDGNLFDFSDWETPPVAGPGSDDQYRFNEGLCSYYNAEVRGYGYIDTQGNKVIEPGLAAWAFHDGYARNATDDALIDRNGNVAFSLDELGWRGVILGDYSEGLFAYRGDIDADGRNYFAGWLNLEGEPVITIYSGDGFDYNWLAEDFDGLTFETTTFSDGYAVLEDHRGEGPTPPISLSTSRATRSSP